MVLSIQEEIPSGPEAVLEGRLEMRVRTSFTVHKNSAGQEGEEWKEEGEAKGRRKY